MNWSFLEGWVIYPASEAIHALQGVLCGYLGSRAILKKEVSDSIIALLLMIGFATYETLEQWKIGDSAYEDYENFWVVAVITGLIYFGACKLIDRLRRA